MRTLVIGLAAAFSLAAVLLLVAIAMWLAGLPAPAGSDAANALDHWAARYQALVAGLIAFAGAAFTVAIIRQQIAEQRRQFLLQQFIEQRKERGPIWAARQEIRLRLRRLSSEFASADHEGRLRIAGSLERLSIGDTIRVVRESIPNNKLVLKFETLLEEVLELVKRPSSEDERQEIVRQAEQLLAEMDAALKRESERVKAIYEDRYRVS